MVRSPVEICLGTSPSQAAKSRPFANASPLPIAATIALEMIGPVPGTLIKRYSRHPGVQEPRSRLIHLRSAHRPAPVRSQVLDEAHHARQLSAQEAQALPHGNTALQ